MPYCINNTPYLLNKNEKDNTNSICLFLFQLVTAQQNQPIFINNPFPKTINVSGSAEMEIVPDEIYVNIELKEYQKKGESKKDLEQSRINFSDSANQLGFPTRLSA